MPQNLKDAVRPRALTVDEAARYCGSATSTLNKKRITGSGPRFIRLSANRIAYLVEDLDAWLDSRPKLSTTSDLEAA